MTTLRNELAQALGKHWNLDNQDPADITLIVNDLVAGVAAWLASDEAKVAAAQGMLIEPGRITDNTLASIVAAAQK